MYKKIMFYLETCYYDLHCKDKNEVKRIIDETLQEYPEETNPSKLGLIVKRRCQGEL